MLYNRRWCHTRQHRRVILSAESRQSELWWEAFHYWLYGGDKNWSESFKFTCKASHGTGYVQKSLFMHDNMSWFSLLSFYGFFCDHKHYELVQLPDWEIEVRRTKLWSSVKWKKMSGQQLHLGRWNQLFTSTFLWLMLLLVIN